MRFHQRSGEKELLDSEHIPFADIAKNMKELDVINRYLGGHRITTLGFSQLAKGFTSVSVCEIGCGGGDNLAAINKFATSQGKAVQLTGIDIKKECIRVAQENRHLPAGTTFFTSDYRDVTFDSKPGIIFSSLFCHHFTNEQLIEQLQWMKENSTIGFFINDLHRHPLAYYSIKAITALWSSSFLVKHDAPLSVLRGFTKNEWITICKKAGITATHLQWRWAFRYLLIYQHQGAHG